MTKCLSCDSTNLVYSGVDAFLLGVPTQTVCYTCAKVYAVVSQAIAGGAE